MISRSRWHIDGYVRFCFGLYVCTYNTSGAGDGGVINIYFIRALPASSVELYFLSCPVEDTFHSAKCTRGGNMSEQVCEAVEAKGQRASNGCVDVGDQEDDAENETPAG